MRVALGRRVGTAESAVAVAGGRVAVAVAMDGVAEAMDGAAAVTVNCPVWSDQWYSVDQSGANTPTLTVYVPYVAPAGTGQLIGNPRRCPALKGWFSKTCWWTRSVGLYTSMSTVATVAVVLVTSTVPVAVPPRATVAGTPVAPAENWG